MNAHMACGRGRPFLRIALLLGVVAAVLLGVSGTAASSTTTGPVIAGAITSVPAYGATVAYSDTEATYIQYHVTFTRLDTSTSALTHSVVEAPTTGCGSTGCTNVLFPVGAAIVAVSSGCPSPTFTPSASDPRHVTCSLGTLSTGTIVDFTMVVRMPVSASGAGEIDNQATLYVKEGTNDSQPQSNYTDTFWTGVTANPLTADTTSALDTWAPQSSSAQTFFTDQNLNGTSNPQSTKATLPTSPGLEVQLGESSAAWSATSCPSYVTSQGQVCIGQLSTISVPGSYTCNAVNPGPTDTCLVFTVVIAGASIGSVNVNKITVYHNGTAVPSCKTGKTDTGDPSTGDCLVSISQDPKTKDLTWVARGPSNGGWGNGFG